MSSFLPVLAHALLNQSEWAYRRRRTSYKATCSSFETLIRRTEAAAWGRSGSRPGKPGVAHNTRSCRTESLPRNPGRDFQARLRTASSALRRSSVNPARYCSTVVALLCIGMPSESNSVKSPRRLQRSLPDFFHFGTAFPSIVTALIRSIPAFRSSGSTVLRSPTTRMIRSAGATTSVMERWMSAGEVFSRFVRNVSR